MLHSTHHAADARHATRKPPTRSGSKGKFRQARKATRRAHSGRALRFESLEERDLLAVVFGTDRTYLPVYYPGAVDVYACTGGGCVMTQGVAGTGSHQYRFFASGVTTYEVTYKPSEETVVVTVDNDKPVHLVTWNIGGDAAFEGVIFNPAAPTLKVTSQWDENPNDNVLGPFLYGVELQNKFTLAFTPALPADMQVQYRWADEKAWREGTSMQRDIGTFPAGTTYLDVHVLDPQGRTLYKYDLISSVRTVDALPTTMIWRDPHGNSYDSEDVRFIEDVAAGNWTVSISAPYLPTAQAYQNHEFSLGFTRPNSPASVNFSTPLTRHSGAGKLSATGMVNVGSAFDDLVPGPSGVDYLARVIAKAPRVNAPYGKPFTEGKPVETTRLPTWMRSTPGDVTYGQTDVFGATSYAYIVDVGRFEFEQPFPTVQDSPLELFDGRDTYLKTELDVKVFASPNVRLTPQVTADKWRAKAELLGTVLTDMNGSPFPKSGIRATAQVEPHALGLDGGGVTIRTNPLVFLSNKVVAKGNHKGLELTIPFVSAGIGTLDGQLKVTASYEVKAKDVSLDAGLQLVEQNGSLAFNREGTFVRLNLSASGKIEVDGKGSLGISPGFSAPPGLSEEQREKINKFRLEIVQAVMKGEGTVNLDGQVQLNAFGPVTRLPSVDFKDTRVTLSGHVSLKYNTCFAGDDVREFFGLEPCNHSSLLRTLGEKTFGPEVILGPKPPKPNPQNPDSFSSEGTGLSGGTGGGGGGGERGLPSPLSAAALGGRLRFHQPFDRRLARVDYQFAAQALSANVLPETAFLELVAVGGGESWLLDRIDLATLDFDPTAPFTSTASRSALIEPDVLPADRSYQLEYRLVFQDEAAADSVQVQLTGLSTHLRGPSLRLASAAGSLDDGVLDFGPDTRGGTVGTFVLHNNQPIPLVVESVEVLGEGFTLVDPSPWSRTVLEGQHQTYRLRLLDASQPAQALLRIRTDDAEHPVREIALRYDGTEQLTQSGPRVTAVALESSAAPAATIEILTNGVTVIERTDLDQIRVTFDRPVRVPKEALQLAVPAHPELTITSFAYDDASRSAVWTLSAPLTDGAVLLALLDSIEDQVGNRLDGELRSAAPTGNGVAGGILQLRANVSSSDGSPALPPAPVLGALSNQLLLEGSTLSLTASATPGSAGRAIEYALVAAPAHAQINAVTGELTWAPPERYPAGFYRFTVAARDAEILGLADYRSFEVELVKTNVPPEISPVAPQEILQGSLLYLRLGARDVDYPAQRLTYELLPTAPAGVTLDPQSGELSWTPDINVAPGTYLLPVEVRDDATPPASSTIVIPVTVLSRNLPPVFAALPAPTGREGELLTFQVTAHDEDSPPPQYRLGAGSPVGATINPVTGIVSWLPGEEDGRRPHAFRIEAVDGRAAELVTSAQILVFVEEVNTPAAIVLPDESARTVVLGSPVAFTVTVDDPDVPATFKEFRLLDNQFEDAKLHPLTGEFNWHPVVAGRYEFTVQVIDYDHPRTVTITEPFTLTVLPDTIPPQLELQTASRSRSPIVLVDVSDNHEVATLTLRFQDPPSEDLVLDAQARLTFVDPLELGALLGDDWQEREYTVEVVAVDAAGNATRVTRSFTIDLTEPAPAELAPEGIPLAEDGSYRVPAPTVDLLGQVEPFGRVELIARSRFGEEPMIYRAAADATGNLTLSSVHLNDLGKNLFNVRTFDAAGNEAMSTLQLVRHTAAGTLGPDRFGYRVTRIAAGFADISATGHRLFEDGAEVTAELTSADLPGFDFEFYGQRYGSVYLSLHGIVSFDEAILDSPGYFPSAAAIAPFWSNAQIATSDDGAWWEWSPLVGGGRLTVQWQTETQGYLENPDGFEHGSIPVRWQAVLDTRDNSLEFHYDSLGEPAWLLAERGEMVFIKGRGEEAIPDLGILLANRTMPFDLIDNQTSLRFELTAEPFPPYLQADWSQLHAPTLGHDVFVPFFPIRGRATDRSGIESLSLEMIGSDLPLVNLVPPMHADGNFTIELADLEDAWSVALPEGQHRFRLRATDSLGNVSWVELSLASDTTAPVLEALELGPESHGRIRGELVTDKREITLVGRTEPGARVTVERDQTVLAYEEADEFGAFEVRDLDLDLGSNVLTFILADLAGNEFREVRDIVRVEGRSSAPDAFGYVAHAINSGFRDISTTGQLLLSGADEELATLGPGEIGDFSFYFYGQEYTSLRVSPNGLLLFGTLEEYAEADYYLEYSPRNAAVVPLGDDLLLTGSPSSGVYWQIVNEAGAASLIVQWHEAIFRDGDGTPVTFQAVLHGGEGSIEFHYANLDTGDGFTQGWESAVGIKAAGHQDVRNWVVELSSYGWENEFVGTGRSLRIDRERIALGAPRVVATQPAAILSGSLEAFTISFDRAMDRSSFALEDDLLEFSGPAGDLRSELIDGRWLDPQTLQIRFRPQHDDGIYRLRLAPQVLALPDSTPVDQDTDGIAGEATDDQITVSVQLTNCAGPDAAGYRACAVTAEAILLDPQMPGVFVIHDFGDDEVRAVSLGHHTLRLYGHELRADQPLFVSTNGLITFGAPEYRADPADLADANALVTIAPLWSDWIADRDSDDLVLGWFQENRGDNLPDRLIIQWQVYNFTYSEGSDASTATFQAIFELDTIGPARITFQYLQLTLLGSSAGQPFPATVGLRAAGNPLDARLLVADPSRVSPLVRAGGALEMQTSRLGASLPLEDTLRDQPVLEVPLRFSAEVTGVDLSDLVWMREGQSLAWTGAELLGSGADYTVRLPAAPQIPGRYMLTLRADDSIRGAAGQMLLVDTTIEWTVVAENSPPTNIELSKTTVLSDQPGAVVGMLSVTDPDAGQSHTWTVSDPRFTVAGGQLKLDPVASIDYRFEREIQLTITVTDSGFPAQSAAQDFVLSVVAGPNFPAGVSLIGARAPERLAGAPVGQLNLGATPGAEFIQFTVDDPRFTVVAGQLWLVADQFLDRAAESSVTLEVTLTRGDAPDRTLSRPVVIAVEANRSPWQNPLNVYDTNGDGFVTPLDALLLINELNQREIMDAQNLLPYARPVASALPYFDVIGDGRCSPIDVLRIINFLNRDTLSAAAGEPQRDARDLYHSVDRLFEEESFWDD